MNENVKIIICIAIILSIISGVCFCISYFQLQKLEAVSKPIEPQVAQINAYFAHVNGSSIPNLSPQGLTYWTVSAWGKDYYYPTSSSFDIWSYEDMTNLSTSIDVPYWIGLITGAVVVSIAVGSAGYFGISKIRKMFAFLEVYPSKSSV